MFAPDAILRTWRRFDAFPMETLTKAWFYHQGGDQKQRNVSMMKEHHQSTALPAIALTFRFGCWTSLQKTEWKLFRSAVRSKQNARMPQSSRLMKEDGAFYVIWEINGCSRF